MGNFQGNLDVMKPSEKVQAALDVLEANIQVIEFGASTATARQAASAAGCELGANVKSLLFLVNENPVLVLVAGDCMADQRRQTEHFGVGKKKIRLTDPEAVRTIAGYDVSGVPPIGHDVRLPVFIDKSLERFDTVRAAAGSSNAVFPISLSRLAEISDGQIIEIT